MKFKLGNLMVTRGVYERNKFDGRFKAFVDKSLAKYINGDWGNTCEEDKKLNDNAVANGDDRIVAKYVNGDDIIFIITEWDRSVTTILFNYEY